MTIKWGNIIIFALLICAIILFVRFYNSIGSFFKTLESIGQPAASADEKVQGIVAAAFIVITVVAVLRLLINQKHR